SNQDKKRGKTEGMAQFQEIMRQQLESSMQAELQKLLGTASGSEEEVAKKNFEGFTNLFQRFLQVKGPSVEWVKIQRPPEDSVSLAFLSGNERRGFACLLPGTPSEWLQCFVHESSKQISGT
uniref:Uncharacterized protein n=1 Tax=Oryzias sinensis TaxID=183150 RepID=A0A8C7XQC9_9TELE